MKINIQNTVYDLALKEDRNSLALLAIDSGVLSQIRRQFEKAPMLNYVEVKWYLRLLGKSELEVHGFEQAYVPAANPSKESCFIFYRQQFYLLPKVEEANIAYILISKLLYESQRHAWDAEPCLSLRGILDRFHLSKEQSTKDKLFYQKILAEAELREHTHFGVELSENSDSEEERQFQAMTAAEKEKKRGKAKAYILQANGKKYQNHITKVFKCSPPTPDLSTRPSISRTETPEELLKIKADLEALNAKIRSHEPLTEAFLQSLDTKFAVFQCRGIHYMLNNFDASLRRSHRKLDERNKAQFSSAVLKSCGIKNYRQLMEQRPALEDSIQAKGEHLERLMLAMLHTDPMSYDGYLYLNLLYVLQNWYSSNYDEYPKRVAAELKKESSPLKTFLENPERPFLSTGDTPTHALLYAYGMKLYTGHKEKRLDPNWPKNNKPERPYSGKVYLSLHPITDYFQHSPSHLTSLFVHGLLKLPNVVVAERETAFLAYLPANRVFMQHIAKYPSFSGPYKESYEYKYGLSKSMYEAIQAGFNQHPPHSARREKIIEVLGEYLCAYHEIRLVDAAYQKAKDQQKVLVYRDENGLFSLTHPATPGTATLAYRAKIAAKHKLYACLANEKTTALTASPSDWLLPRLRKEIPDAARLEREQQRFFSEKKAIDLKTIGRELMEPIPIPTLN